MVKWVIEHVKWLIECIVKWVIEPVEWVIKRVVERAVKRVVEWVYRNA